MNKLLLLLIILCGALKSSAQQYFQQDIHYTIDVTLDDAQRSLDGFIKIQYTNNSPDSLPFIWIHCWPNAFKNDRTAFSEQLLGNGRTDFYFSNKQQRGYMNRLDFRADGQSARMEDHPQYIDIIKVVLPKPLPPGSQTTLSTPFHVQLPYNFSRGGYRKGAFQITQWYPKPAVYDRQGWHPIPYLDQGEFYSEFGSFDVRITLPQTYVVAATGDLQSNEPNGKTKTLRYAQDHVHDFAWFADRRFKTNHDTLQLPSGRTIHVYSYYTPDAPQAWKQSLTFIKDAVRFRSAAIGEYPYNTVTAVETKMGMTGGMEYPTITAINEPEDSPKDLDLTIEHEVGHNWFYGILASNERRYPWMDEGLNTYYDRRYEAKKYGKPTHKDYFENKLPPAPDQWYLGIATATKQDQPISTSSEEFTKINYFTTAYTKTGNWLTLLEKNLGAPLFDSAMHEYYRRWQFKHPYPEDFKNVFGSSDLFSLIDRKGPLTPPQHKTLKAAFLYNYNNTDKYEYINIIPAIWGNKYDKVMLGAIIHNYNLPPTPFQFLIAPLYATGSHQLNGIGNLSYTFRPNHGFRKITASLYGERFSSIARLDSNNQQLYGGYYRVTPTLRFTFPNHNPRSTQETSLEWKTYLIGERFLDKYLQSSIDSLYYPIKGKYNFRYLNQLSLDIKDTRVLYPYKAQLQVQQAASFYRVNLTGNYFFNYEKGGGLDVRIFGAKFGYIGNPAANEGLERFQPKLTAVRGEEDYTYGNYFLGRTEFTGATSQQIMLRDGNLHLRTDLFQDLQGRSDNWIASLNMTTTLPKGIVPEWLPLKAFLDLGTYSEAWQNNPPTSHFLYVAGLQLSLVKDFVRIYVPLFYSKDFRDQLKTVPDQDTFLKRISFSLDIQNIDFKKLLGNIQL
ncbi:MAG: M1 family metallopeptidase [Bacteroidetes bacterium]|nr:M1 family metallopeptidase [Bacteroidota bacterium]